MHTAIMHGGDGDCGDGRALLPRVAFVFERHDGAVVSAAGAVRLVLFFALHDVIVCAFVNFLPS